jgi:hypothetical protein
MMKYEDLYDLRKHWAATITPGETVSEFHPVFIILKLLDEIEDLQSRLEMVENHGGE